MQKFTKIEIAWIASEFDKLAKELKLQSEEAKDREFAKLYLLRSEQYADISRRFRLTLKDGAKRIEIK